MERALFAGINLEAVALMRRAVNDVLDVWAVPVHERAALIGDPGPEHFALQGAEDPALMERMQQMVAIEDDLRTLFPAHPEYATRWPSVPNADFGGMTPLEVMAQFPEGMARVLRYLDMLRLDFG